jgi:hypothetical protein
MLLLHPRGGREPTLAESIGACRAGDDRATKCGLCERGIFDTRKDYYLFRINT